MEAQTQERRLSPARGAVLHVRSCWLGFFYFCHFFSENGALWISLATPGSGEHGDVLAAQTPLMAHLLLVLRQLGKLPVVA